MQYSEFNINPLPLKLKCILCGLSKDKHTAYHIFNPENGLNIK